MLGAKFGGDSLVADFARTCAFFVKPFGAFRNTKKNLQQQEQIVALISMLVCQ